MFVGLNPDSGETGLDVFRQSLGERHLVPFCWRLLLAQTVACSREIHGEMAENAWLRPEAYWATNISSLVIR